MIGIFTKPNQIILETFELFKIPWEYYQEGRQYQVIIADDYYSFRGGFKMLIIFNPNSCQFDKIHQLTLSKVKKSKKIRSFEKAILILNELSCITGPGATVLETIDNEVVAVQFNNENNVFIRVGYDLFGEVGRLLNDGQIPECALIPSVDIHLSLLRNWIINNGIGLLEIPPKPLGYDFITCLTHDIDFFFMRSHKIDHTILGLLYRTSIGALLDWVQGRSTSGQLLRRWKFLFEFPLILAGSREDPWVPSRDYPQIEKGLPATYFFIPFRNCSGYVIGGNQNYRRACKYEVDDLRDNVRNLVELNQEIGVHGLDAWKDIEKARQEKSKIVRLAQKSDLGIRMHWLFFDTETPKILEDAGYLYDSTLGYNDAVGYRNGTVQPFRFLGLHSLMELPLNAQDTAMLYRGRMGLKEAEALTLIDGLIENHRKFGGVLTLNWHDRSLAPERLWGDLYGKVLERLKKEKTMFCTAKQAVNWFKQRRSINFEGISSVTPSEILPGKNDAREIARPFQRIYNNGKTPYQDIPLV